MVGVLRLRLKGSLVMLGAVAAVLAIACSGYFNSVHFLETPDFGVPPPPFVISVWGENRGRPAPIANTTYSLYPPDEAEGCWERSTERAAKIKHIRDLAAPLEAQQEWNKAREVWTTSGFPTPGCQNPPEGQPDFDKINIQEFIADRSEVLKQLAQGGGSDLARQYLVTTATFGDLAALRPISEDPSAGFIRAHALYALGMNQFDHEQYDRAAVLFQQGASVGGPRRERALVMAVRCLLCSNRTDRLSAADVAQTVKDSQSLIAEFRKEFPASRFKASLNGWEARADFLQGNRVEALERYLELFRDSGTEEARVGHLSSIRKVGQLLTPEDAKKLRQNILNKPGLLKPYLEFRLYHTNITPTELGTLVSFVEEARVKQEMIKLSPDLHARLGEMAYLRGMPKIALRHAEACLLDNKGEYRDLATYVKAGSLHKLKDSQKAYASLAEFETKFPNSYLIKAVREFRAMLAEKLGKWSSAITEYRALGYKYDAAYLIDVRMSIADLEQSVLDAAMSKEVDTLRLAIGYRRLRKGDYLGAKSAFLTVGERVRKRRLKIGSKDYQGWSGKETLDLIPDPLVTLRDLTQLSKDRSPKGRYALASYYYNHRNLMLYNADLWDGSRTNVLWSARPTRKYSENPYGVQDGWNFYIATPNDVSAVKEHFYSHECLWRVRQICLGIAKTAPNDPIAPLALYRAATATRRLARFNSWWDRESLETTGNKSYYLVAADLLKQLYTNYPKCALAKNARKYEKVFRQEKKDNVFAMMFSGDQLNID